MYSNNLFFDEFTKLTPLVMSLPARLSQILTPHNVLAGDTQRELQDAPPAD